MFVAYAVCVDDQNMTYDDGLGFVEIGATRDEALVKLIDAVAHNYDDPENGTDGKQFARDCLKDHHYRFYTVSVIEGGMTTICHNEVPIDE